MTALFGIKIIKRLPNFPFKFICSNFVVEATSSNSNFPNRLLLHEHGYIPTLGPGEVNKYLIAKELALHSLSKGSDCIKGFDSNQLAANSPIEDRRMQGRLQQTDGVLFAVVDGHAGAACAQSTSERLLEYIALALLSPKQLEEYNHSARSENPMILTKEHKLPGDYFTSVDMTNLHKTALLKFCTETLSTDFEKNINDNTSAKKALTMAFEKLDADFSTEALPDHGRLHDDRLAVAMSGCCCCVAHINHLDVHVANVGDTKAVLGSISADGEWLATSLAKEHNTNNHSEVERILNSHPKSENEFLLRNDRLLGQLVPLRALGDMRYKWPARILEEVVKIMNAPNAHRIIPPYYYTPPYLISKPEIVSHRLTIRDKFLILASDGIWDMLSMEKVVQIIGNFLMGKETRTSFQLSDDNDNRLLSKVNSLLKNRRSRLIHKTSDNNAATHIIRHALGYEHKKVSEMLSLPSDVARLYRDDMTITIIFFDSDYIAKSQAAIVA